MILNNAKVLDVRSNPGKGRFATRTFYTVTVQGDHGEVPIDWNTSTIPSRGDVVNCEVADTATYGKHKLISANTGPFAGHSMGTPAAPRFAGAFPIPQDSKEQSIVRQSALKAAVDLITAMPGNMLAADWEPASESWIGTDGVRLTADAIVKRAVEIAFTLSEFSSGALELDVTSRLADKLKT